MRSRYAPTPSGYLHIGNAANFVAIHTLAQRCGADILLRIDDVDTPRVRREYVQDIFDVLRWLDLPWDLGPNSPGNADSWSQLGRLDGYRDALAALRDTGEVYLCSCSRAQWATHQGEDCPSRCRERERRFELGRTAWRLRYDRDVDPVLWRREDVPAYHLTSVVDDDSWGVDLIVRGTDLAEATRFQRYLSSLLPGSSFSTASVLHHGLAADQGGRKLSKSAGGAGSTLDRTPANKERVMALAEQFVADVSSTPTRSSGS